MSAKVDQFCDKLRDQLDTVERRLQTVKSNIQELPEQRSRCGTISLKHKASFRHKRTVSNRPAPTSKLGRNRRLPRPRKQ